MVKRLDELEDHYKKANAAEYDGYASTLSQYDMPFTGTLPSHPTALRKMLVDLGLTPASHNPHALRQQLMQHLDAGREVFNEYRRTGVLPKDFKGITHPGVVSAVKEQIAHDVHENIGLDITRRGDIQTDEGWSKAKEAADQFDPQRYGRTAVEAKAKHAADPTFSHDMYRLVDDLKKRPRHTSVKGLNDMDSEENIELLGRRIRGRN